MAAGGCRHPTRNLIQSNALAYRGGIERNGIGVACYKGLIVVDVDRAEPAILERLLCIICQIDSAQEAHVFRELPTD
jgi:hypothetical protein